MASNSNKYINRQLKGLIHSLTLRLYECTSVWLSCHHQKPSHAERLGSDIEGTLVLPTLHTRFFPGFVLGPHAKTMTAALTLQIFSAFPVTNEVESAFLDCGEKAFSLPVTAAKNVLCGRFPPWKELG